MSSLERAHVLISDFCRKRCFIYIDNRNIRSDFLYKDGLYLIDKRKAFLADNFIVFFVFSYIIPAYNYCIYIYIYIYIDR